MNIKTIDYHLQCFLRYCIVGISNTVVGLGTIFILFNVFKIDYVVSNIIGYGIAIINSFKWNKAWTFRSSKNIKNELLPFLIIFIISYLSNLFSVIISIESFNINPNLAQLMGITIFTIFNYSGNSIWTFRESKQQN
jgi:putative flippase GtrA